MQKLQKTHYTNSAQINSAVAFETLNLTWDEAEVKLSELVGARKGEDKVFTASVIIWKANSGIVAEVPQLSISGKDVYEAANKIIAKISQKFNTALETVTLEPDFYTYWAC